MFPLLAFLRDLFRLSPRLGVDGDEAYLAEAADMCDLERRMRQLDRGERDTLLPAPHGIFAG